MSAIRPARLVAVVLGSLLVGWALLSLAVWFQADRLLFQPHEASYRAGADVTLIPTRGGEEIAARWLPAPGARYTLLYAHGNAEDLGDLRWHLEELRSAGFSVLAFDYRGYGASQGRPSTRASAEDADAAYDHLVRVLGVPPERIIAHGRSLGGGVMAGLASRRPVAGLVLESTFVSAFRVVPWAAVFPFDRMKTERALRGMRIPVLVVHGSDDAVVPEWHGRALYGAARGPKHALWIRGAGHDDLADVAGERYARALRDFAASLEAPR